MTVGFDRPGTPRGGFFRGKARWLGLLGCILACLATVVSAVVDVPARPENYLLDQGGIFSPELKNKLETRLRECARDLDVHLYVMTAPTLRVMPSRTKEKAQEILKETRSQWLKNKVGALLIFDDEAGSVTIGASDEATSVLPAARLNAILKDPQFQSKRKHLPPDKLAATALLLADQLSQLRAETRHEARMRSLKKWGSIAAGVALLAGVLFWVWKRRAPKPVPKRRHRTPLKA